MHETISVQPTTFFRRIPSFIVTLSLRSHRCLLLLPFRKYALRAPYIERYARVNACAKQYPKPEQIRLELTFARRAVALHFKSKGTIGVDLFPKPIVERRSEDGGEGVEGCPND